jgi:hypothetical protein
MKADEYDKAYEAWLKYLNRCDEFDRSVCIGRTLIGRPKPLSATERGRCARHAREAYDELLTPIKAEVNVETFLAAREAAYAHYNGGKL